MKEAYLLLGSNQGDVKENLKNACRLIVAKCGPISLQSSLYQTAAWGIKEQADFINMAVVTQTMLPPIELLNILKAIEKEIGRVETIKWGPRIIDIDILFYDVIVFNSPELTIPHPYIAERRFTLEPLNEIAPGFTHPVLQNTITTLLEECTDSSIVKRVTGK